MRSFAVVGNEASVWLGPRLMYSLARHGFPEPLAPDLKRLDLDLGSTVLIIVAGEIDCRVHLVERIRSGGDLSFVAEYVERVSELRDRLAPAHVVLLGLVPPSDSGVENPDYPRNGTLSERVEVSRLLEAELCSTIERMRDPGLSAFPLGLPLADSRTGELARRFTEDGCHVNEFGARLVRFLIADRIRSDFRSRNVG